ncbi:conserved hypothetical protein [Ahrensia sp. R2A130]|nr:conserved hypothetical protein [Ahrensia sp. R2A130]
MAVKSAHADSVKCESFESLAPVSPPFDSALIPQACGRGINQGGSADACQYSESID